MDAPQSTIMLAEDTDDIRHLLKLMLEMKGYRIVEAIHGQQALDLASTESPDLIFMDLNMPILSGWEATRRLRLIPAMQNIPIIGLSAHCRDGWRDEAIEAGCDECIQKPIDDEVMDKVLSQFLRPREPRAA